MPKTTDDYGVQYQQCASPTNHEKHIWTRRVPGRKPEEVKFRCPGTDPYQEARLALRDVLGMEPDEQMIQSAMREVKDGAAPWAAAAYTKMEYATKEPDPALDLTAGFGIAVSGGGFAASATVDTDDTVNGLARLRAHSALDALLDQHGISR